jgi:3-oxoacyl-[acyl-carrier protein] reductase
LEPQEGSLTDHTLLGQVAIVTGASRGIGRAIAVSFGTKGATVVVNYLRSSHAAAEVAEQIRAMGGEVLLVQADVTVKADVDALIRQTATTYGRIDILVNNAGGLDRRVGFLDCTQDIWERNLALNLHSVYLCCRSALKVMVRQRYGKIVNISSLSAQYGGSETSVHYAAAKGAVNTLTIGLAREFAQYGILVNAVAPGLIDTPAHAEHPRRYAELLAEVPCGRAGRPDEVAELVAFLVSDKANYMTGAILPLSGGRSLCL